MTLKEVGIVILIGAALFGGFEWEQEREARVKAEQLNADSQATVAQVQQVQAQADANLQKALAQQQTQFDAEMKTVEGQINYLQASLSKIPGLPQPIVVTTPAATTANPTPASVVTVPQLDLTALDNTINQFNKDQQQIPQLQSDLVACQANTKTLQTANIALTTQLKGGSFWHKALDVIKKVGIGIGIGLVLAKA